MWLESKLRCNRSNTSMVFLKVAGFVKVDILYHHDMVDLVSMLTLSLSFFISISLEGD
jgi:hypothetical protein